MHHNSLSSNDEFYDDNDSYYLPSGLIGEDSPSISSNKKKDQRRIQINDNYNDERSRDDNCNFTNNKNYQDYNSSSSTSLPSSPPGINTNLHHNNNNNWNSTQINNNSSNNWSSWFNIPNQQTNLQQSYSPYTQNNSFSNPLPPIQSSSRSNDAYNAHFFSKSSTSSTNYQFDNSSLSTNPSTNNNNSPSSYYDNNNLNSSFNYFNLTHVPVAPSIHNYSSSSARLQPYNPFEISREDDYNGFSSVFSFTDKGKSPRDLSPIPYRKSEQKHNISSNETIISNKQSNRKQTNKNKDNNYNDKRKKYNTQWVVKDTKVTNSNLNRKISPNRSVSNLKSDENSSVKTNDNLLTKVNEQQKKLNSNKRKREKNRKRNSRQNTNLKTNNDNKTIKKQEIIIKETNIIEKTKNQNNKEEKSNETLLSSPIVKEIHNTESINISNDNDNDTNSSEDDINKNEEIKDETDNENTEIDEIDSFDNLSSDSPSEDSIQNNNEFDDIENNKELIDDSIINNSKTNDIIITNNDIITKDINDKFITDPTIEENEKEQIKEEKKEVKSKKQSNYFIRIWMNIVFLLRNIYKRIFSFCFFILHFLYQLHYSALNVFTNNNVAFTIIFIYAFPFIVSSISDETNSASAIMWYIFLVAFFITKRNVSSSNAPQSLNFRLLFSLLFVFDGVCNPQFIVLWNGGERLVLAFVLLSMKSNGFFHWSCFISLALLIITSVILGTNIIIQWAILVIALSTLSTSFSLDPLIKNNKITKNTNNTNKIKDNKDELGLYTYNPSFEANILPPATTVGFYQKEKKKSTITPPRKRNHRRSRRN